MFCQLFRAVLNSAHVQWLILDLTFSGTGLLPGLSKFSLTPVRKVLFDKALDARLHIHLLHGPAPLFPRRGFQNRARFHKKDNLRGNTVAAGHGCENGHGDLRVQRLCAPARVLFSVRHEVVATAELGHDNHQMTSVLQWGYVRIRYHGKLQFGYGKYHRIPFPHHRVALFNIWLNVRGKVVARMDDDFVFDSRRDEHQVVNYKPGVAGAQPLDIVNRSAIGVKNAGLKCLLGLLLLHVVPWAHVISANPDLANLVGRAQDARARINNGHAHVAVDIQRARGGNVKAVRVQSPFDIRRHTTQYADFTPSVLVPREFDNLRGAARAHGRDAQGGLRQAIGCLEPVDGEPALLEHVEE
mmetsp:Transcript_33312/g.93437  ORF Transcript_33312/g.93437 Transcript_33312/m.93437 type:complete len:356 (-) Transcript_33312:1211-2278(-)